VNGKFYGDFLKERVFTPLGMTTARVITEADIVPNRAAGYWLDNGQLKNQQWVSPTINTTADGSLYLTVLDMAKWEAALNAGRLLKNESYQAMWTPVKLNNGKTHPYGFGWTIDSLNGKLIIEHGGTWQGFESVIKRYPEKRLTVAVFANLRGTNVNIIARRIMQFYHPKLIPPREQSSSGSLKTQQGFKSRYSISSYYHIPDKEKLPAMLIIHGATDYILSMHPAAKYVAKLQEKQKGDRPILLLVSWEGGHLGSQEELLYTLKFMLWQSDHPDFQLKK
jgi:hypothetical protein